MKAPVILAIDPAKSCGVALHHGRRRIRSCTIKMPDTKKNDHPGLRFYIFRAALVDELKACVFKKQPDVIVIEWAKSMRSGAAMAMHGFIRYTVMTWAAANDYPVAFVGPKTVKKHATGNGNADKAQMVAAARKRWRFTPKTDDEADACWIADTYLAGLAD